MSLHSPFLLIGILLLSTAASSSSEDVEKKAVVKDDFEVDYETASSLAGLAIECHDQVQSVSIARSQGLLESFCVRSSGNFLLARLHSSCSMAHQPGELPQILSSKHCDRAIDALCRSFIARCFFTFRKIVRCSCHRKLFPSLQEWPHKYGTTYESEADMQTPREKHPIFYGCFDWHSAVHGHWLMASAANRQARASGLGKTTDFPVQILL